MADHEQSGISAVPRDHNRSSQANVAQNDDPALDISKEHHHGHIHHDAHGAKGHDEPAYTVGTTADPSNIPNQHYQDQTVHRRRGNPEKTADVSTADDSSKDEEKGHPTHYQEAEEPERGFVAYWYIRLRLYVHIFIFLLFTGWWIASLILHRNDKNWIKPFLLWLAISLRLLFFHVPITIISRPMKWTWVQTGRRIKLMIPEKWRIPLGALLVIAVILIGSFVSAEAADNTRENRAVSLFGIVVALAAFWATSRNRDKIVWHTIIVGMLTQFIIALFVLRTTTGFDIFSFISELARDLLGFAKQGVAFLTDDTTADSHFFFFTVLPAIVFFISLCQMLYYWGILQWFITKAARFFFWTLRISGAEAVVATASPFIGQGESAMLIRPFVPHLTMAELHQVMTSGFATISGSAFIGYLGLGVNGQALITSCIMSIPASIVISKLRWPETEETLTSSRVIIPDDDEHKSSNTLHAFANGAWLGIKIAGMILATLLCIVALVGLINGLLTWWGKYINIGNGDENYHLTLQLILGYVFYPVAFLLGVPRGPDLLRVGRLIGTKIVVNEFVAYTDMQNEPYYANLSPRSRLIATYALAGFANFGSLGTQIGVISQISPSRSADVSRIAFSALISGAISTLTSAAIAGLIIQDESPYVQPSTAIAGANTKLRFF